MMGILHSLFKMAACVSGVLVIAQASGIAPQWKDLTAQSYQIYLIVVTRQCEAFGRLHSANSKFAGQDECYLYSCYCYCNRSWQCPPELTVKTCADTSAIYDPAAGTCRQCVLGENRHDYKEAFEVTRNCIRYRCICGCDGTYTCPSRTATRVCRTGSGLPGRIPSFSSSLESSYSSTIDGSSRTSARGSGVGGSSVSSDGGSGRTVVNIRPPDRSSLTSTGGSSSTSVSSSSSSSSSSTRTSSSSSRRTGGAGTRSSSYEASRSGSSTSCTGGSIDLGSLLTGGSDRGGSGRGSGRGGRGGPCKNCIVDDQP